MADWKVASMNCSQSVAWLPNTFNIYDALFFLETAQSASLRGISNSSETPQRQPSQRSNLPSSPPKLPPTSR